MPRIEKTIEFRALLIQPETKTSAYVRSAIVRSLERWEQLLRVKKPTTAVYCIERWEVTFEDDEWASERLLDPKEASYRWVKDVLTKDAKGAAH